MKIPLTKTLRIFVIFIIFSGLVLYLFLGYPGRVLLRPQTFCQQVEADAEYISSNITDIFYLSVSRAIEPAEIYAELPVDAENPWRITKCGKWFFIHVFDRSGKCPAEYQKRHQEWSGNTYTLKF